MTSKVDRGPVGPGGIYSQKQESHSKIVKPSHPHKPPKPIIYSLTSLGQSWPQNFPVVVLNLKSGLWRFYLQDNLNNIPRDRREQILKTDNTQDEPRARCWTPTSPSWFLNSWQIMYNFNWWFGFVMITGYLFANPDMGLDFFMFGIWKKFILKEFGWNTWWGTSCRQWRRASAGRSCSNIWELVSYWAQNHCPIHQCCEQSQN